MDWFNFHLLDFIIIKISTVMKFSGFFLLGSAVNSLNWLNNSLRQFCHLYISSQRIHSFQICYGWTNENFDCWGFQKEVHSQVHLKQNHGSLLLPLIRWKSRKFRWLHLGCIHELQKSRTIEDSLSSSIFTIFTIFTNFQSISP